MNIIENLKYSSEHEWVRVDGNIATIGITDFAQSELGDLVYVEVETIGETLEKDEIFGTIEAVKTTSDLFMPIGGKVIAFNPKIDENEGDSPSTINEDPYNEGWIIQIEISDIAELEELLDAEAYKALIS